VQGWWTIDNQSAGSFVATITIGSGQVIAVEQGTTADILIDGVNVKFRNLPPVGTYLDICDATTPAWITACTVPPYLNCDGSSFSAVTYPYLNSKLGGNTLPDFKGRNAYYMNQGSGRLTTAGAGIDGNVRFSSGGHNGVTLTAAQIPSLTSSGSNTITVDMGGNVPRTAGNIASAPGVSSGSLNYPWSGAGAADWVAITSASRAQNITVTYSNSATVVQSTTQGTVSGIRLIRAA